MDVGGRFSDALPLVIAGAVSGIAGLLTTVVVARVLPSRGYGAYVVLLGLFLVLSLPGSALLVGVVRRVAAWETGGARDRVGAWARRVHLWSEAGLLALFAVVWLVRDPLAHALSVRETGAIVAVLTAGGVWVLVSIDRGLLQARRDYHDLSVNLIIEAVVRSVAIVAMASALGVTGAGVGLLLGELVTALHARYASARALRAGAPGGGDLGAPAVSDASHPSARRAPLGGATTSANGAASEPTPSPAVARRHAPPTAATSAAHTSRTLAADVLAGFVSLALLAMLQNADVIMLGSQAPHRSGSYAAISVPAKALVFGALVFINYLLPEAAIRSRLGAHALRPLWHTLAILSVPSVILLAAAVVAPTRLLRAVFGSRLTAGAPAFATLVLAMIFLCVTVVLSVYLLGVGWRWVVVLLGLGAVALIVLTAYAGGHIVRTARADLAVQATLATATTIAFVIVHRRGSLVRSFPRPRPAHP